MASLAERILRADLADLVGVPVDLVTRGRLKPPTTAQPEQGPVPRGGGSYAHRLPAHPKMRSRLASGYFRDPQEKSIMPDTYMIAFAPCATPLTGPSGCARSGAV